MLQLKVPSFALLRAFCMPEGTFQMRQRTWWVAQGVTLLFLGSPGAQDSAVWKGLHKPVTSHARHLSPELGPGSPASHFPPVQSQVRPRAEAGQHSSFLSSPELKQMNESDTRLSWGGGVGSGWRSSNLAAHFSSIRIKEGGQMNGNHCPQKT